MKRFVKQWMAVALALSLCMLALLPAVLAEDEEVVAGPVELPVEELPGSQVDLPAPEDQANEAALPEGESIDGAQGVMSAGDDIPKAGNTLAEATPISLGTEIRGTTSEDNQSDFYSFVLPTSGHIDITGVAYMNWHYYSLYDADGNSIYSSRWE